MKRPRTHAEQPDDDSPVVLLCYRTWRQSYPPPPAQCAEDQARAAALESLTPADVDWLLAAGWRPPPDVLLIDPADRAELLADDAPDPVLIDRVLR